MKGRFFSPIAVHDLMEGHRQKLVQEIQDLDAERVLSASFEDLCAYFEQRFYLDVPRLHADRAEQVRSEEYHIDVSNDRTRVFRDEGPHYIPGLAVTIAVPFDGDPDLFQVGTGFGGVRPRATVVERNVLITYATASQDAKEIDRELRQAIEQIEQGLKAIQINIGAYNLDLPKLVRDTLDRRRKKVLKDKEVSESVSFPLRRAESPTHPVPIKRKPLAISLPASSKVPFKPEPALEMQQYDEVLTMLANMSESMERTPKAFAHLGEEHLRDHFLMVLNANFQGDASGETFNVEGKTDILIRADGRTVFIAECKFWSGAEGLRRTIDQLLGYVSWRDTKTAIVLLNRRVQFSTVLAGIPDAVASHSNYKRQSNGSA